MVEADRVLCDNCGWTGYITKDGAQCPGCHCIETMQDLGSKDVPKSYVQNSRSIESLYKEYEIKTEAGEDSITLFSRMMRKVPNISRCCPFCLSEGEAGDGFNLCSSCGETFHRDTDGCFVPKDTPLLTAELFEYEEKDSMKIYDMPFTFHLLRDSTGIHPIWENQWLRIFATLEYEGDFGLFVEINDEYGCNMEKEMFDRLDERPRDYAEYREMTAKAVMEMLGAVQEDLPNGKRLICKTTHEEETFVNIPALLFSDGTKIFVIEERDGAPVWYSKTSDGEINKL